MRRFSRPLLIMAAGLAFVACGGGTVTSPPAGSPAAPPAASEAAPSEAAPSAGGAGAACESAPAGAAAAVEVEIKDFSYSPDPVTASVGDVVAWTNADSAPHTASLEDGSCGTENLNPGDTGALVFNAPGTYMYRCNVHPGQMSGFTIEVQ